MRTELRTCFRNAVFCGSLLVSAQGALAADSYVPIVLRTVAVVDGPTGPEYVAWESLTSWFNTDTKNEARFSAVAVYGPGLFGPNPTCTNYPLSPLGGTEGLCVLGSPECGPGFVKFTSDAAVLVSADIQRVLYVSHCGGTADGTNVVLQGSAPLPVYHSLFPAASTVVAGPVDLGALDKYCITGPLARHRRVNVTLFNAGDAGATFNVSVQPFARPYPNRSILDVSQTVAPLDVVQLNALPIPLDDSLPYVFGYDIRVWIRITATQPFLAYVSTIFDGGEPGTNAFTVYEAKQTN